MPQVTYPRGPLRAIIGIEVLVFETARKGYPCSADSFFSTL